MTAPAETTSMATQSPFFRPFGAMASQNIPLELAREGAAAFACGCAAFAELAVRSQSLFDPLVYLEAQTRFWAHLAEIGAEAAAERLRAGGVTAPLLND